jgi:pyruvate kinase
VLGGALMVSPGFARSVLGWPPPFPFSAEATDVANAVLDGVDGFLLGAETLRGKYPVLTVKTILSICRQAEKVFDHDHHFDHLMRVSGPTRG